MLPKWDASKAYGDELVGCKVKVWRLKSSTFSKGVVASYNHSNKIHKVVYTDGVEEMLNLTKHVETAEDVSADQAKTTDSPAREFSSMNTDDDMDADLHARKKHKGPSSVRTTRLASPVLSKDLKTPKLEADISPTDSKLSSITGDDDLLNVNAYKVKASAVSAAPILEAIFEKYGDIAARCIFKSASVRASLLEVVCNVVQKLQHHDLEAILSDLENIANEVSDVAASNIEVSWLSKHLTQLHKIVPFKDKSIELRKTKGLLGILTKAADDELNKRQAELRLAEERFKEADRRLVAVNLVGRKIDEDILESESEEYFWRRRLDDLL
ncbi:hypothetical protein ACS0TY_034183 [Phlomoides rotata]